MSVLGGTWTCHVCGDERPDELIDVYSEEYSILDGRVDYSTHVRYCADRPFCRRNAPGIGRRWAAPMLDRSPV